VNPAPGATTFTLSQTVPAGSSYDVTVITQPSSPAQNCAITSGATGTANANVTSVVVRCTNAYTIGGTITGTLTGTGLVIKDSVSGNTTTVAAGATTFTITPAVASGSSYSVSVMTQPSSPTEACSVTSGATGHATHNVTSVVVHCSISQFTVGGTISGYTGSGLVMQDTVSGNHVTVPAGESTFAIPAVNSGATYMVAVLTNPTAPTQACTITSGASGTVGAVNVTSVVVSCVSTFTVGGTISGLTGTGLVLTDSVSGNTVNPVMPGAMSFTLTPAVNSGTNYNVTVTTQPTGPAQFCSVTGGTGTVTMNVVTIGVSCVNVGRFVFVANPNDGSGSVAALSIDPGSGALTLIGGAPITSAHATPIAVAVDPGGGSLYVANEGAANVDTYTIGGSGALTSAMLSSGTGANSVPLSLALDPAGDYLYVGSAVNMSTGTIGEFSITGGTLAPLSVPYSDGNVPSGVAVDSVNGLLFAANTYDGTIGCFTIANDGSLDAVSNPTFPGGGGVTEPYALAVAPAGGYLYITDISATPSTVTAYSYTDCSALTLIGSPISVGDVAESVTIDPAGKYLYVANSSDGTVSGFTITAGTGALTSVGSATATGAGHSGSTTALIVDPSSQYLYVANGDAGTISLLTIGAGGVLMLVGTPVVTISTSGGPSAIAIE
jgi:6-phosphogluconolactonase (cycloisomerase 2 family)